MKPGIQPGGDSSGYINLGTALEAAQQEGHRFEVLAKPILPPQMLAKSRFAARPELFYSDLMERWPYTGHESRFI